MNRFYDMNKIAKFFVVCAAVFVLGLILFVIGITTGGVDGLHKVAEDRSWVREGAEEICTIETKGEFNAVEAMGPIDIVLIGEDYFDKAVKEYNLEEEENLGPGSVLLRYGDNFTAPEVTMNSGTLEIKGIQDDNKPFVGVDFSGKESEWPVAIVFCGDKKLKSVTVSSEYADVEMKGVAFAKADIQLDSGDAELENITGKGLKIHTAYGDVEVSGDLTGKTEIDTDSGDIEVSTVRDFKEYSIEAVTSSGDIGLGKDVIEYSDDDEEGYQYIQKSGKASLLLKSSYGDIGISNIAPSDTVEL